MRELTSGLLPSTGMVAMGATVSGTGCDANIEVAAEHASANTSGSLRSVTQIGYYPAVVSRL